MEGDFLVLTMVVCISTILCGRLDSFETDVNDLHVC